MRVLVPVKRVVDPYVKIHVKSDGSDVETNNVKMAMNPFDEIALEQAVRFKEAGLVEEIITVSIGDASVQETLRQSLAFGSDKAIHVESDLKLEPLAVAKLLKEMCQTHAPDFVIMGKQAIDDDYNQTGQMLAFLMDWPQATFASDIELERSKAKVTREVDGGLETIEVNLPCVMTTDLRLNEPRNIGLPAIMKAKKKPLETVSVAELGVDIEPRLTILKVEPPKEKEAGIKVESVEALVDILKNKEKVI